MQQVPSLTVLSMHTSPLAQPGSGDAGGLNVVVMNTARALARAGTDVHVYTLGAQAEDTVVEERLSVHTVTTPEHNVPEKHAQRGLVDAFAAAIAAHPAFDADAPVHSHYWLSGLAAQRLPRHGARWVHTMHTTATRKAAHGGDPDPERAAAEERIAAEVDVLTANGPLDRDELIQDLGIDPEKVVIVRPGVDTEIFTPDGPSADWPLPRPQLRPLFAGRLQPYKGPQVAIAAVARLHQEGLDASLRLIGDPSGPVPTDTVALAREHGVEQLVSTLPPVAQAELAAAYRAADLVLVPSAHETYGLVAAEALACGTPVMAHRTGGLTGLVRPGVNGELLEDLEPTTWARALEPLVRAGAVPQAWREHAADGAAEQGWDRTARELATLLAG